MNLSKAQRLLGEVTTRQNMCVEGGVGGRPLWAPVDPLHPPRTFSKTSARGGLRGAASLDRAPPMALPAVSHLTPTTTALVTAPPCLRCAPSASRPIVSRPRSPRSPPTTTSPASSSSSPPPPPARPSWPLALWSCARRTIFVCFCCFAFSSLLCVAPSRIQRYVTAAQHFDKINNKNYVGPAIMITAFASFVSFVRWVGGSQSVGLAEGPGGRPAGRPGSGRERRSRPRCAPDVPAIHPRHLDASPLAPPTDPHRSCAHGSATVPCLRDRAFVACEKRAATARVRHHPPPSSAPCPVPRAPASAPRYQLAFLDPCADPDSAGTLRRVPRYCLVHLLTPPPPPLPLPTTLQ